MGFLTGAAALARPSEKIGGRIYPFCEMAEWKA